jgi:hypothetical protein
MLEHFRTLLRAQPITGPESELLDSLDAANARRLREPGDARLQAAG